MEALLIEAIQNNNNNVDSSTKKTALNNILDYEECLRLLLDVGAQIELLKERGFGILSLDKNDIFQLSSGGFMINPDILSFRCDNNGMIRIDKPFDYSKGMAPELQTIKQLPSTVSYNVAYFSLKQLTLDVMQLETLTQLEPTKMFYLLERCSKEKSEDRSFLFI